MPGFFNNMDVFWIKLSRSMGKRTVYEIPYKFLRSYSMYERPASKKHWPG